MLRTIALAALLGAGCHTATARAGLDDDAGTKLPPDATPAECTARIELTVNDPSSAAGAAAMIDLAIVNHRPAGCAPLTFSLAHGEIDDRVTLDPADLATLHPDPVPGGATGHVQITAIPAASVVAGTAIAIPFQISESTKGFTAMVTASLTVVQLESCDVDAAHELMITSTSVVDDPVRTAFAPASSEPRNGVWTFKHLMENVAPTPADAPAMVEAMLTSFTVPQTINGFAVGLRPRMKTLILDRWPRTSDGALDLAQAPFVLQAIVNRFDLRDLAHGDAGEGRFVFAFVTRDGGFLAATLIMEYKLPAASDRDVLAWASAFHALGAMPFGEAYNAALQQITERFTGRGARPDHPNGSAINAVRTNEIAFGGGWEMREIHLSAASGFLEPALLELTPDRSFNFDNSAALASFIQANQAAIIAESHTVPAVLDGQPFQAGSVINFGTWGVGLDVDPEARHHFALNTCNGCHSSQETNTGFLQISPRDPGTEAQLSEYLTGTTVADPVTGVNRTFNELGRRNADFQAIVCAAPSGPPLATLRKGISRVH